MTTDILIVTWHRDAQFLDYALSSIERYCSGFRETVVLCPTRDEAAISPITEKYPGTSIVLHEEYGCGHHWQMMIKVHADQFTDADMILLSDSDCLFKQPTTPESFLRDGKPIHLMQRYDHPEIAKGHNGGPVPWQAITERDCGWPVPYEYMRRQGFMYPRWLLKEARKHLELRHRCGADEWIMKRAMPIPPGFRSFCEYNFLNAFAHQKYPEQFCFLEVGKDEIPEYTIWQGWSHNINHPINNAVHEILAGKSPAN